MTTDRYKGFTFDEAALREDVDLDADRRREILYLEGTAQTATHWEVLGLPWNAPVDAAKAAYEVENYRLAVLNLCLTNVRTVVGSMDLDQLLSHRDEINERLLRVMDAAASPWGVKVTRIEIRDILPPADIAGAMNRQMKAEREKRAAVLEAEGQRQAEILKAEGQKQAQILAAEGRKEAALRDAEARERLAQAEATATAMVSEAIGKGDIQAANFLIAERYTDALKSIASSHNSKVVIVPIEAASLAGTVGGIAQLTKAVFGEDATAQRRNGAGSVPTSGRPGA